MDYLKTYLQRAPLRKTLLSAFFLAILLFALGFSTEADENSENMSAKAELEKTQKIVNVYSARKRHLIKPLLDEFTKQTGIKVNLTTAKANALIARLNLEKERPNADFFIASDVSNLHRAKSLELLQAATSDWEQENAPLQYRDPQGHWHGLSVRSRVIIAAKSLPASERPKRYEDLAAPKWRKRICVRSSGNVYNQSLVSSLIVANGVQATEKWAQELVNNFARAPVGGDRDQAIAVANGLCDLALINMYYLSLMRSSSDPEQVKAADAVVVIWPNQDDRGTHVNISGGGVVRGAKHAREAELLLRFLLSRPAQLWYAKVNREYPVIPISSATSLNASETFKRDDSAIHQLGALNREAVKLADRVGWR